MDGEKAIAVRAAGAPYRGLAKLGCQTVMVLVVTFAYLGHWNWIGWLLLASLLAAMGLGSWLGAQGPADDTQRTVFRMCLTMAGLGSSGGRALGFMTWMLLPALAFITFMSGNRHFVRAARRADIGWMVKKLRSPDSFDRWRAVVALDRLGGDNVIADLLECLGDEDSRVREAAVSALSRRDNPATVEQMQGIVDSCTDDIQWLAALSGLYGLGHSPEVDMGRVTRAVNLIRTEEGSDRDRLGPLLSTLPFTLIGDLVRTELSDIPQSAGWSEMTRNLLRQGCPKANALVREMLLGKDDLVALQTLLAMRNEVPMEFADDLERLTHHPSERIRTMAELQLKRLQPPA